MCVAAARLLIHCTVPRHNSNWSHIPSCKSGIRRSAGRHLPRATRGHWKGAFPQGFCGLSVPGARSRGASTTSRDRTTHQFSKTCLTAKKQGFASQIFYILTLWTTKTSILLLYMRLSPSGGHKIATWTMLAASTGWALLSIVLISVPCNPAQFYTSRGGECTEMVCTSLRLRYAPRLG